MHNNATKSINLKPLINTVYFLPFLKICILSLDSSTLPSASMIPGKVRRAPGSAGELTAATLLWTPTTGWWLTGKPVSSTAVGGGQARFGWSMWGRRITPRTGEVEPLWRAAAPRPSSYKPLRLISLFERAGTEAGWDWLLPKESLVQDKQTFVRGISESSPLPTTLSPPLRSHMTAPRDHSLAHIQSVWLRC